MQRKPLRLKDKSEYVISTHFLTRCASKQCINDYQIPFQAINAV